MMQLAVKMMQLNINAGIDDINICVYAGEVAGKCRRGRENRDLNVLDLGDGFAVVKIVAGEMENIVPV